MSQSQLHPATTAHDGAHAPVRLWTKGGPVDSRYLVPDEVSLIEERHEASVAEPASMALLGFATGTFIVAWPLSGFVAMTALPAAAPSVLLFAGIAQFIGGLIALRRENQFAGTAFGVFGANNVVIGTFLLMQATGRLSTTPGSGDMRMLALELFCFGYIALMLGVVAMRLNGAFVAILLTLAAGFTLSGIQDYYGASMPSVIGHLGGYFLIASAALAAYTATAMVINSTWQRPVLPLLGPRNQTAA
jgi:succinate-acetate transporter protein